MNTLTMQHSPIFFEKQLSIAKDAVAKDDFQRAFRLFSELQKLDPKRGDVCFYFGSALLSVEEFDAAIEQLSLACQLLPTHHEPLFKLADAFETVNSVTDVETVIKFALAQFPQHSEVFYRAANFYREVGQLSKADKLASECIVYSNDKLLSSYAWLLKLNLGQMQDNTDAYDALSAINNITLAVAHISDNVPDTHSDSATEKTLKMIVNYALGRYFELVNNTELAFRHWKIANLLQLSMCDYRVDDLSALFAAIKANSNKPKPDSGIKTSGFTPIFILGLPRTGSTLLEQLLCQHSDVSSLGEQTIIANQVANFAAHHAQQPYPYFMPDFSNPKGQEMCQQAANIYERAVKKRQLNTSFVIDKLPANFQSVGLIKSIFPHAKIIHLTRQFADTGLSIFKNHFAANEPYLCDLEELSAYHQLHCNLMQHWHKIYPNEIFEIAYETVVRQPQAAMQEVLTFCGLSHQQQCWQNNKDDSDKDKAVRMIKTLSSAQVTEPIHQRAIGQHSKYAAYLKQNGLVDYQHNSPII
ncbi:MAG: tetratricopeptide (TPR) repeat protein [Glaciecola sp.]|jgi:tetratricopeptide (TPR) repeat protein